MNRDVLGLAWLLLGIATLVGATILAHRVALRASAPGRGMAAGLAIVATSVATVAIEGAMLSSLH